MKWIKINPGGKRSHTMTEEQREAAKERLQNY